MFNKRLIAGVFLSTLFVLAGCSKDNANDASDFTIQINDIGNTKTITITGYIGTSKDVRIPAKIDKIPVTVIGDFAFNNDQLASVTIPNSVTHIGIMAFNNNQLTSVTIPNSVTYIGNLAFNDNPLTSATIPKSVTNIGEMAFFGNQLKNITIPNSVTDIGDYAFANNLLTSVTLSNSMTDIRDYVFANNLLTNVILPNSVTNIGDNAFQDNRLTKVTIPSSVTHIGEDAFIGNQLMSVTIPNSVTYIGGGAFCENQLTSVTIPNSVTYIGEYAFANNQLTSVVIPDSVTYIGDRAFAENPIANVTIPNSVTYLGEGALPRNQPLSTASENDHEIQQSLETRVYLWEVPYNPEITRLDIFNDDNTITSYYMESFQGFSFFQTNYWTLRNGVYICAGQRPITDNQVYLLVNNAGAATMPSLNNMAINEGRWLTPSNKTNALYTHGMVSISTTKNYPFIAIIDQRLMRIAIQSDNQVTNLQDIAYTESKGILSFVYNNKAYKYFSGGFDQADFLIQFSGDDTLAPIYIKRN
jgi:hypothetical protein